MTTYRNDVVGSLLRTTARWSWAWLTSKKSRLESAEGLRRRIAETARAAWGG